MQIIYDMTNDSIFDASRLTGSIGGLVLCLLFLVVSVIHFKDYQSRKSAVGTIIFVSCITVFNIFGFMSEWDDYKNNYYFDSYLSGNYEVAEGLVSFNETDDSTINFKVNDTQFSVISKGYNNRGFHTEDYDGAFKEGDFLKVCFVNRNETAEPYRNYGNKVIVKIEVFK